MTLKAIAKECANWVREKVKFKSNITNSSIPNLIGIQKLDDISIAYNPVNGFATIDLGYQQGNSIFTDISKTDFAEQSKFLFSMFDEVWNDKSKVEEITDNVIEMISSAYQENSPEFIYFIILYNIFSEFLDDISKDNSILFEEKLTEKMVTYGQEQLVENGYKPYYMYKLKNQNAGLENVGFYMDKVCLFNIDCIEETTSVLAIGANEITKRVFSLENRIERQANVKFASDYIARVDELIQKKKNYLNKGEHYGKEKGYCSIS